MSDWIDVITESALAEGEHVVVDVDGSDVAVFKTADGIYAVQDVCTHDGAEIASGRLEGNDIICPRHGAKFCLKTGAVLRGPAYEALACFPLRVAAGVIQVRDGRWD